MFTREGNSRQKLKPRQTGILKFCCLWEHVARRNRRKNSHLCLNDGSVDFWCSEATFRGPRQSVWGPATPSAVPIVTVHSTLLSIYRTYNSANLGPYGWKGKERHFSHSSHSFSSASNSEQLQNASEDSGPRAPSAILQCCDLGRDALSISELQLSHPWNGDNAYSTFFTIMLWRSDKITNENTLCRKRRCVNTSYF